LRAKIELSREIYLRYSTDLAQLEGELLEKRQKEKL